MIETISAALQIKKELPDAIGYEFFGINNIPVPIPIESSEDYEIENIIVSTLSIFNYSSKIKKEIRILFSGNFKFQPIGNYEERQIKVDCIVDEDKKEIIVSEALPKEAIQILIPYPDDDFKIESVIADGHEITRTMQKLAAFKRYPDLAKMTLSTLIVSVVGMLALICSVALVFMTYQKQNETHQNNKILEKAFADYNSYPAYLYENPVGSEEQLVRKYYQLSPSVRNLVLGFNKVSSFEELRHNDKIILFKERKIE